MDIYDKLIIVCIIFTVLAILSIVFGCYYFTNKTERFTVGVQDNVVKTLLKMLKYSKTNDTEIVNFMKQHSDLFKNEKFIDGIVKKLKDEEPSKKPKESFKSKAKAKPKKK
tara:strand:- start:725 stop:1057 length:333 start_codon:yes stop_codon:yes gene_type:complete